ncbi:MAG: S1 family peptidase, partial [Armatimonadota bacterium]
SFGAGTGDPAQIEAVFHPDTDDERRQAARVVRESAESGMALLALEGDAPPAISPGDDVPDRARVVLITNPLNTARLVAEAGRVRRYADTDEGRFLQHTAGRDAEISGPVFDADGALIGMQVAAAPGEEMAIPAVEISQWLQMPGDEEVSATESGQVLGGILRGMGAQYREHTSGEGYLVSGPGGAEIRVRQTEDVISVEIELGSLHVGNAIDALRSNYSDPVGAFALKPREGADQLVWVARILAESANAEYLDYVTRVGVLQSARWEQIEAGQEPDYPYEHYPGGDEAALSSELATIVHRSGLSNEASGQAHKIYPESDVPVFVNEFRGMAYVHAYSGGVPGKDGSEQEQIARELVRRNWELPLGRLSLDKHRDLACEAQAPMEHLSTGYLAALVRVCQDEVARIKTEHGQIPFNEQ